MALDREQMDKLQCSDPECAHVHDNELVLTGSCHPCAPVVVMFLGATLVRISCASCDRMVTAIQVDAVSAPGLQLPRHADKVVYDRSLGALSVVGKGDPLVLQVASQES